MEIFYKTYPTERDTDELLATTLVLATAVRGRRGDGNPLFHRAEVVFATATRGRVGRRNILYKA